MQAFEEWDKKHPPKFENANKLIGEVIGRRDGWKAALEWLVNSTYCGNPNGCGRYRSIEKELNSDS